MSGTPTSEQSVSDPLAEEHDLAPREPEPESAVDEIGARIKPLLVGVGLVLVLLVGSAVQTVTALGSEGARVKDLERTASKLDSEQEWALLEFAPKEVPGVDVKLGTFVVNPLGAAKVRYVRVSIVLTVTSAEVFEATGVQQARARAAILEVLSARTVEELGEPGGMNAARELLQRRITRIFPEQLLIGVHFPEFLVQ